MPLVDTPIPKLDIHESARPYITDAYFDGAHYADYLHGRGITEEQLASLALTVTNEGIGPTAVANFGRDGDFALIRFSARRMPRDIGKQNVVLFHETEHFIWEQDHTRMQAVKTSLIIGSLAVGSFGTAGLIGHQTFNATEGLPIAVRGAASLASGVVGGISGGLSSVYVANGIYQEFSPNETNARRAAKREAKRNPVVLRIV